MSRTDTEGRSSLSIVMCSRPMMHPVIPDEDVVLPLQLIVFSLDGIQPGVLLTFLSSESAGNVGGCRRLPQFARGFSLRRSGICELSNLFRSSSSAERASFALRIPSNASRLPSSIFNILEYTSIALA